MGRSVSVVVVAYRSGRALLSCLDSIRENDPDCEIVLVDNGGGGPEIDAAEASGRVTLVRPPENVGFGAGCNLGAAVARGDALVFINPDAVLAPGALRQLVSPLEDSAIGIVTGNVRMLDRPDMLHAAGTTVHVSGLGWSRGYGGERSGSRGLGDVPGPCGAAMAMRAEVFRRVGGFHDEFFLYMEDVQLGWRARMLGLRVVVNPAAVAYHDYDWARHVQKRYFMERNRIAFVGTCFALRTLILLAPLLVATELAMLALAVRQGWLRDKLRGWGWLVRNARLLLRRRRETQRLRQVRDRDLASLLTAVVDPAMIAVPGVVRALNPLAAGYWSLVRRAM